MAGASAVTRSRVPLASRQRASNVRAMCRSAAARWAARRAKRTVRREACGAEGGFIQLRHRETDARRRAHWNAGNIRR
jgi:hypothetical protein